MGLFEAKVETGVFVELQRWSARNFPKVTRTMGQLCHSACLLPRHHKAKNYVEFSETQVKNYSKMGYKMSIVFHNLNANLENSRT